MPGGDRTGPEGWGPMTGRGMGYCTGNNSPGYTRPGYRGRGRGFGGGLGRGRGWRNRYYATGVPGWARAGYGVPQPGPVSSAPYPTQQATPVPDQELSYLQSQAEVLRDQLDQIQQRISELESNQ
jgi:hypothetical protein